MQHGMEVFYSLMIDGESIVSRRFFLHVHLWPRKCPKMTGLFELEWDGIRTYTPVHFYKPMLTKELTVTEQAFQ